MNWFLIVLLILAFPIGAVIGAFLVFIWFASNILGLGFSILNR